MQQNQMRTTSHPQRQATTLTSNFLNDLLQQQQPQQQPQPGQMPQQLQRIRNNNNNIIWEPSSGGYYESPPNDPDLKDILDQLFATDSMITATEVLDALQASEGISNTAEISAGVSNVTLSNPVEVSDQDEKAAINAITRSFMQCEQTTNIKRMQGVRIRSFITSFVNDTPR